MMTNDHLLAEAAQHVRRGKRLVIQQHGRIAKLRAAGDSTLDAEMTLDVFQCTLRQLEESARRLHELC
jgi:hypothetical protein